VHQYLHEGVSSYALVTGASDGIGKSVARELCDQGFNLIIHGRNEEKVRKVAEELRARGRRDVQYFIADASKPGHDFAQMVAPFKALNITLVVHNVGGTHLSRERVDGLSESDLSGVVTWNAVFPLFLTRALLPQLRASAKLGPVIVQFIGSVTADICTPRLPVYGASKAFLRALARGLDNDERVWDAPTGVRFVYLSVGEVQSNSQRCEETLVSPSSARFAKALVAKIGCGKRAYAPWMPHAVMLWVMGLIPESTVDSFTADAMNRIFALHEKVE